MGFEEIKFLTHFTSAHNLQGIVRDRAIMTTYDRWNLKTDYTGNSSTTTLYGSKFRVTNEGFPGVGMSWHLGGEEPSMYDDVTLVFGRDLVRRQKNFHLNLADKNGYFIEGGTFFPGDKGVPRLRDSRAVKITHGLSERKADMNEIVFHDSVSMDLCEEILVAPEAIEKVLAFLPPDLASKTRSMPDLLPRKVVRTKRLDALDTDSLACRVYFTDIWYTGFKVPIMVGSRARFKSGIGYVRSLARLAGADKETLARLKTPSAIETHMLEAGLYTKCFLGKNQVTLTAL